jgi:TIR domain
MLAKDLETAGIRVWFAEWDLDYGDDVVEEIQKGLNTTRKLNCIQK